MVNFEEKVAEDIKLIYIVFLVHLNTTSVKTMVLFKCTYCILLQTGILMFYTLLLRRCRNRYFAEVKFAYGYDAIEKYQEE